MGDLGLAQSPAQVGLGPVDDGREVDQTGVDVAQLDLPFLETLDELLDPGEGARPRVAFLGPAVAERRMRNRFPNPRCFFVFLAQLDQRRSEERK